MVGTKDSYFSLIEILQCRIVSKIRREYSRWNGETSVALSKAAKENSIYVVGGTIPEIEGDKLYNTCCTIWGPDGTLIAKHRKVNNIPPCGFEIENIGVEKVTLSRNNLGIYICTYVYYNQFYNLKNML